MLDSGYSTAHTYPIACTYNIIRNFVSMLKRSKEQKPTEWARILRLFVYYVFCLKFFHETRAFWGNQIGWVRNVPCISLSIWFCKNGKGNYVLRWAWCHIYMQDFIHHRLLFALCETLPLATHTHSLKKTSSCLPYLIVFRYHATF